MDLIGLDLHGRVAMVTLNRPEKRNALNAEMRAELQAVLGRIARGDRVRAAVVTGAGEAFAAGADIAPMAYYTPRDAEAAARHGNAVFSAIESAAAPFIAAVNGYALAGGLYLSRRDGLDLASRLYGEAYRTKDSREGIAAYLEKRPAVFTGR